MTPPGSRRRALVVLNPRSANGHTGRVWPSLSAAIRGQLGDFDHVATGAPGDATRLTRDGLARGYDMIVSVGGDGTHNEVLNGFFDAETATATHPDAVLAVVSSGTGGDFRRTLGQPKALPGSVRHLAGDATVTIDVGHLTCRSLEGETVRRMFLNISSFGMSGGIVDEVNHSSKALGGFLSFFLGTVKGLARWNNQDVTIRVDGGEPRLHRLAVAAVANGRFFGGGMEIAPRAQPNDGCFDLMILGDLSTAAFVRMAPSIYRGTHLSHPLVSRVTARTVEAESGSRILIDLDGEMPGMLPASYRIVPAALKVKVRY